MLPTNNRFVGGSSFLPEYIRRILNYPQMDLEYTAWQMLYLCIDPVRVYRTTSWHKQTKNQWARDDPAFVAILLFFMAVSSLSFAVAFHSDGIVAILKIMVSTILFDFVFVGVVIATIGWFLANRYLRIQPTSHNVDQKVEWLYAFDIHCNSFFPVFVVLYALQYFVLPLLLSGGFFATAVGNTMYLLTFGYYFHITFLGYQALPFLQNTIYFLYPIAGLVVLYIVSLLANFNMCIYVMNAYFGVENATPTIVETTTTPITA